MTLKEAAAILSFNPRAHEGRDRVVASSDFLTIVSTHAPTRGATYVVRVYRYAMRVSTHAPTRGATIAAFIIALVKEFQPTRPRGARRK